MFFFFSKFSIDKKIYLYHSILLVKCFIKKLIIMRKQIIWSVFLSLFLVSCNFVQKESGTTNSQGREAKNKTSGISIFPYGEYKGLPVELEYDSVRSSLALRVAMKSFSSSDEVLNYLKYEVIKLFILGDEKDSHTGRGFHCAGYPIWCPYSTSIAQGDYSYYQYLLFTEYVIPRGDVFYLIGDFEKTEYYPYLPDILVGEDNFEKIVNYIQLNGSVVADRGVPCNYQYTFYDSDDNPHKMIAVKRDKANKPSIKGEIRHISIWSYYDGIIDQDHAFSYIISKKSITLNAGFAKDFSHYETVKKGYEEFLAKI